MHTRTWTAAARCGRGTRPRAHAARQGHRRSGLFAPLLDAMALSFDVSNAAGLGKLNEHLASRSYVTGCAPAAA
jgi:hypothetical protein